MTHSSYIMLFTLLVVFFAFGVLAITPLLNRYRDELKELENKVQKLKFKLKKARKKD